MTKQDPSDSVVDSGNPSQATSSDPSNQPPPFTLANVTKDIIHAIHALIYDPHWLKLAGPLVVCLTLIASKIIIAKVPYTEIDFSTYMQQVDKVNQGEIDYSEIYGDLGPIVYPGGFVAIYRTIAALCDNGADLRLAQEIFSYVLIFTNFLVVLSYLTCDLPPWTFWLLVVSKRIFSIYVLRMFNDCFTTLAMVGVVLIYQQAASFYWLLAGVSWLLAMVGMDLYLIAVLIKMNALLYLPAVVLITYFVCGQLVLKLLVVMAVFPIIQVVMGWNYLVPLINDDYAKYIRRNYINIAFDFKRKFMYKWTVNWRFVREEWFDSDGFARGLLILHVVVLFLFVFTRFLSSNLTGVSPVALIKQALTGGSQATQRNHYLDPVRGPRLVFLVFAVTNLIGVAFLRSLHYQFLLWYLWQLPFLLWATGWKLPVVVVVWVAHEWCWNVFPLTNVSSALLVSIYVAVLFGLWWNTSVWWPVKEATGEKKKEKKEQ